MPLLVSHCPSSLPRALPALTCLVVVIDLHLGWLQALHGDVPLHREGEAEGLPAQLGKGSSGGSGGLCTAGAPLCLRTDPRPLHSPQPPTPWPDTGLKDWLRDKGKPWGLSPPWGRLCWWGDQGVICAQGGGNACCGLGGKEQ